MKESIMEIPKDSESVIRLSTTNGEIELRQSRTRFYTFLGHYAMSHIFIESDEQAEEGRTLGYYIFMDQLGQDEESQLETFTQILNIGLQGGFEMHVNIQEPAECDIEAYTDHIMKGFGDGPISPEN